MRIEILPALIILLINILIDLYIYNAVKHRLRRYPVWKYIQAVTAVIFNGFLLFLALCRKKEGDNDYLVFLMWGLFVILSVYVPKIVFVIFDLLASIPKVFRRRRIKWLSTAGGWVALILFILFWWGALINRFAIDTVHVDVESDRLPETFTGLTIAQISDLHVGTYGNDTSFVSCVVDEVNRLKPDLIVFTGDLVNRRTSEAYPFVKTLSRLEAPLGVFAVRGNHDYGDYMNWPGAAQRDSNNLEFTEIEKAMGWIPLDNSTAWLRAGNDSIALIGVENIGDPPFAIYGNLSEAYPYELNSPHYKILLSHNPAHWANEIKNVDSVKVDLTLSGHTHAMQASMFGVSPAALRYKNWGGLYKDDKNQQLYVNIGIGEVGMPARIGATPEITLFTLKSTKKK